MNLVELKCQSLRGRWRSELGADRERLHPSHMKFRRICSKRVEEDSKLQKLELVQSLSMECCLFHSRFEVIRRLGEGSFGLVLLCKKWEEEEKEQEQEQEQEEEEKEKEKEQEQEQEEQDADDRKQFAIKIVTKDIENEDKEEREIDALYRLRGHHNIIMYYESWCATRSVNCRIQDGREEEIGMEELQPEELFIVMEFCPQTISNQLGTFHKQEAWLYFSQLITALAHIHMHGFIHRDISNNNIFFREDGCLVVADFGCAVEMVDADHDALILGSPLIGTGPICCTRAAYCGISSGLQSRYLQRRSPLDPNAGPD